MMEQLVSKVASKQQIAIGVVIIMVGYALIPEIKQWFDYKFGSHTSQEYSKNQLVMEKLDRILAYEAEQDSAKRFDAAFAPYKNFMDSLALDRHIVSVCKKCQLHGLGEILSDGNHTLAVTGGI